MQSDGVSNHPERPWGSSALRRRTSVAYATLFAILIAVSTVLYYMCQRNSGLSTPSESLRYLWIYSPSAIFVVISGYWYLREANAKLLAPWCILATQPTDATERLQLDYVSQSRYASLLQSLKLKDWDVSLAVIGSCYLNLLIAVSTGLFTLRPMVPLDTISILPLATRLDRNATNIDFSVDAMNTAYAVREYGLQFPIGTTSKMAYQSPEIMSLSSNSEVLAIVDSLYPQVSCEIAGANWTYGVVQDRNNYLNTTRHRPGAHLQLNTPSCRSQSAWLFPDSASAFEATADGFETFALTITLPDCDEAQQYGPARIIISASMMTFHDTNMDDTTPKFSNITTYSDAGDYWKLSGALPLKISSSHSAAVACRLDPIAAKARLKVTRKSVQAEPLPGHQSSDQMNSTIGSQLLSVISRLPTATSQFLSGYNFTMYRGRNYSIEKYGGGLAPFFQLMNSTNPRDDIRAFVDSEYLMDTVGPTIELIAAQLVADSLFQPTNGSVTAIVRKSQDRLSMNSLAFGIIVGTLGLMICISILSASQQQVQISMDPGTLLNTTILLAREPWIMERLQRIQKEQDEDEQHADLRPSLLQMLLRMFSTYSGRQWNKKEGTSSVQQSENRRNDVWTWWQPWNLSLSHSCLRLVLPILGIIVLEALLRRSERLDGLAAVSSNEYVRYLWIYIPVLTIFALNFLFDATSFSDRIVQPYLAMAITPVPASRSISMDFVNKTTVSAMVAAIRCSQYRVASAIVATLVGAALPIASSSLFQAHNTFQVTTASLNQVTYFDPSLSIVEPEPYPLSLPLPGLIHYNNLTYPAWTHGKYALPRLGTPDTVRLGDISTKKALLVDVPAIYGVANCTPVPKADISFSLDFTGAHEIKPANEAKNDSDGILRPRKYVESRTPPGCPRMRCTTFPSVPSFYEAMWMSADQTLHWDTNETDLVHQNSVNSSSAGFHGGFKLPPHCPLSMMCINKGELPLIHPDEATEDRNHTHAVSIDYVNVLHCSPYVAEETVTLNLSLSRLGMNLQEAPKPQLGSRAFFSQAELINTVDLQNFLPPFVPIEADSGTSIIADAFFSAVFSGRDASSPMDLLKDDISTDSLLSRIDEIYGLIVSQTYGKLRRFPADASDPRHVHNATLIDSVARVRQDIVSTRIVQLMLGVMFLCTLVSMFYMNRERILPERPCSLATRARLIDRSNVFSETIASFDLDARLAEETQDVRILRDGMFSIGWWGSKGDRWYGVDSGTAERER
jgi:hypothetical protein